MGAPTVPKPLVAPPPADTTKAQLNALAYAETQRRLRKSQGRQGSFLTTKQGQGLSNPKTQPPTTSVLGGG